MAEMLCFEGVDLVLTDIEGILYYVALKARGLRDEIIGAKMLGMLSYFSVPCRLLGLRTTKDIFS